MPSIKDVINKFMLCVSYCSLYSKKHPSVRRLTFEIIKLLDSVFTDYERFELMVIEDDLICNKRRLTNGGAQKDNLVKKMKRAGLSRIDFIRGITAEELYGFIADLSEFKVRSGAYNHIKTGIVDILAADVDSRDLPDTGAPAGSDDVSQITMEQFSKVRDIFNNFSKISRLEVSDLEEIVVGFIYSYQKESNIFKLLSPVKAQSEYTYTHASNVAILSMHQADSMGLPQKTVHDIGIAALLHDVGKLLIPDGILEKDGKLTEDEYHEITKHPYYGAVYLSKVKDLTPLAPIAAFEHHMRFDRTGYPKRPNGKAQHFCSQIIQISDVFDALRSKRPYKREWRVEEILALLKRNAGTEFNPEFVDNFSETIADALS